MAEIPNRDRLQPSLLDRLTDNEPDRKEESRTQRVLSMRRLREAVVRDLLWLLNATRMEASTDLSRHPLVAESVLNFGVPDLAGVSVSTLHAAELERSVRQAIWNYEPRLKRSTISVRVSIEDSKMARNAIAFEIEGELWAEPMPMQLFVRTVLDLEDGEVAIAQAVLPAGG